MKRKILLSVLFLMFVYTGCTGESAGSDKDTADSGSTDNALDSASDSNSEIKFDSDSNIIAGTDSDSSVILQPLRIEAECGFGADKGDCNGVSDGTNSELPGQDGADNIPLLKEGEQVVGYFYGGSWLAFPGIDLTGYTLVSAYVASAQAGGTFEIRLDAPDGELVATIEVPNTGSWETFELTDAALSAVSGVHTVYLLSTDNGTYNGDVDWIEFSAGTKVEDTDTGTSDTGSDTNSDTDTDINGTRGRVKIKNNTLVTDIGTLIRGGRVSLDIWDETPSQADVDIMKSERGLNAFHIYAEYAGSNQAGGYNAAKVDHVVDLAEENGLYVILTIGCGGDNGSFNQTFVTQFWDFYAPRYKDRTHVVYELMNEPQAWSAPYNTATLAMEKSGYDQIRALAPDTHIMMMSYSQPNNWTQAASECEGLGIDWSNASVAFHTYGIDNKEQSVLNSFFGALQGKGIAYTCTEPNLDLQQITTPIFESLGVSQTYFISVHNIATDNSSFYDWITSNNICWSPDFGTWPTC